MTKAGSISTGPSLALCVNQAPVTKALSGQKRDFNLRPSSVNENALETRIKLMLMIKI